MPVWIPERDFALEAALGNVSGVSTVNKFGVATDCDNGIATDVWDGADGVTSTDIWVPPTTARIHDITSTSASDTSAGTGLRTIRIFGLQDWDSKETSEDVTLNGVANVPTANSYVIIHRMIGLTYGSVRSNVGVITATAQTDGTVTAAMLVGNGSTLMAILGVPSVQNIAITNFGAQTIPGTGQTVTARTEVIAERDIDQATSGKSVVSVFTLSNSFNIIDPIVPPAVIPGPMILKVQTVTDTNNSVVTATFDAYLVDK